jgi:hypothetical protein
MIMRIRSSRLLTVGVFSTLFLLLSVGEAFAWTATYLGGNKWAITCAGGNAYSYSGSSAGLDTVGPALCPADSTNNPAWKVLPKGVSRGVPRSVDRAILLNKKEIGDNGPRSTLRTYPPHGYPCLGCVPCPAPSTDYCDIENKNSVLLGQ